MKNCKKQRDNENGNNLFAALGQLAIELSSISETGIMHSYSTSLGAFVQHMHRTVREYRPEVLLETMTNIANVFDQLSIHSNDIITFVEGLNHTAERYSKAMSLFTSSAQETIEQWSRVLRYFASSPLTEQVLTFARDFSATSQDDAQLDIPTMLQQISMDADDLLIYENVAYTPQQLSMELEKQVAVAKREKKTVPELVAEWKNRFWGIVLIFNILMFIPQFCENVEFYKAAWSVVENELLPGVLQCYTIKERCYLRQQPNARSTVVKLLVYDTPLEIIDDIPRWYQVRFVDEHGVETIGWISKNSVETEE